MSKASLASESLGFPSTVRAPEMSEYRSRKAHKSMSMPHNAMSKRWTARYAACVSAMVHRDNYGITFAAVVTCPA